MFQHKDPDKKVNSSEDECVEFDQLVIEIQNKQAEQETLLTELKELEQQFAQITSENQTLQAELDKLRKMGRASSLNSSSEIYIHNHARLR
jgi:regulator of replication initiation timing